MIKAFNWILYKLTFFGNIINRCWIELMTGCPCGALALVYLRNQNWSSNLRIFESNEWIRFILFFFFFLVFQIWYLKAFLKSVTLCSPFIGMPHSQSLRGLYGWVPFVSPNLKIVALITLAWLGHFHQI